MEWIKEMTEEYKKTGNIYLCYYGDKVLLPLPFRDIVVFSPNPEFTSRKGKKSHIVYKIIRVAWKLIRGAYSHLLLDPACITLAVCLQPFWWYKICTLDHKETVWETGMTKLRATLLNKARKVGFKNVIFNNNMIYDTRWIAWWVATLAHKKKTEKR